MTSAHLSCPPWVHATQLIAVWGPRLEEAVRLVACWGDNTTVPPRPDCRGKATERCTVFASRHGCVTQLCNDGAKNSIDGLIARNGSCSCDRGPFTRHTPCGVLRSNINLELNVPTGGDLANWSHTGDRTAPQTSERHARLGRDARGGRIRLTTVETRRPSGLVRQRY